MLQVMEEVTYVQKDKTNDFQHYNYASEAAAIKKIRPALIKAGLFMLPSVEKMWLDDRGNTHVEMLYRIFDISGDYIQFKAVGSGQDKNGDKGVYKALTGASKYALLKTFMLETGDDPEVPREDEKKEEKKQPLKAVPKEVKTTKIQPVVEVAKVEDESAQRLNFELFSQKMIEWVILGFSRGPALGLDVECHRELEFDDLVTGFFSPIERKAWASLPLTNRCEAFFAAWTRKEAYLKALGVGLAKSLDSFSVSLGAGSSGKLVWCADHPRAPQTWHFVSIDPAPGYAGALALDYSSKTLRTFSFHAPGG